MTTELPLRNEPKQSRSIKRLDQIVDAGWRVLVQYGRDRLTAEMVAQEAGCSIGTFYRYFPDRVALLDVLLRVETLEKLQTLPAGTVLLCREKEVFWLPPKAGRVWVAAGYDPAYNGWLDEGVLEWAPLRILHLGTGL